LQKSEDGLYWQMLTAKPANSLNPVAAQYTAVDENPFVPVTYFRVKAIAVDGKIFYSGTKKIDFGAKN